MWAAKLASNRAELPTCGGQYNIPTVKATGGQRIDLLGVKKEDGRRWNDIGMPSGHAWLSAAYREDLRRQRMVP
jgi:nitrite reductase (NADH) large subunit